jgi:GTP cyclohydrolase II
MNINHTIGDLRLVEIAPVEILGKTWYCAGLEESSGDVRDNLHLALILSDTIHLEATENLVDTLVGAFENQMDILVRIHSECLLADALGSTMCDCGRQLRGSLNLIAERGRGVLIYLRQEGRGIGLRSKLACLALQEGFREGQRIGKKYSADQANLALDHPIDQREYDLAASLLRVLGISSVHMITGNMQKVKALQAAGITVTKIIGFSMVGLSERAVKEIQEKLSRHYVYDHTDFQEALEKI